jgi:three-Cys-motif partner protein
MDINRNVLRRDPGQTQQEQIARMNTFWGDESWRAAAYSTEDNLFGYEEKTSNQAIVNAFRERLKKTAGFQCVPPPLPMRNSNNADVYYLFFASKQPLAERIARDIFKKYR